MQNQGYRCRIYHWGGSGGVSFSYCSRGRRPLRMEEKLVALATKATKQAERKVRLYVHTAEYGFRYLLIFGGVRANATIHRTVPTSVIAPEKVSGLSAFVYPFPGAKLQIASSLLLVGSRPMAAMDRPRRHTVRKSAQVINSTPTKAPGIMRPLERMPSFACPSSSHHPARALSANLHLTPPTLGRTPPR